MKVKSVQRTIPNFSGNGRIIGIAQRAGITMALCAKVIVQHHAIIVGALAMIIFLAGSK